MRRRAQELKVLEVEKSGSSGINALGILLVLGEDTSGPGG